MLLTYCYCALFAVLNDMIPKIYVHMIICFEIEFLFECLSKLSIHRDIIGAVEDVVDKDSMDKN